MRVYVGDINITQMLSAHNGKYITLEWSEYSSKKKTCCGGTVKVVPDEIQCNQLNLLANMDCGTDAMIAGGAKT